MDERETYQTKPPVQETTTNETDMSASQAQENTGKGAGKRKWLFLSVFLVVLIVLGITAGLLLFPSFPKGYEDYTVQKEQYYVEYSEEYDYWDVLTVEYPRLEGPNAEIQEQINQLLYDTAMDRVTYWHLEPSEEVKAFQEEFFSIFASDVNCDVTYHSQYLLSADYREYYSAGNPVWMTNGTERALTIDLLTGQSYELNDILEINSDLIRLWDKSLSDELGEEYADDEDLEAVLSWFLQSDEEINQHYFCHPFFYLTEDKDFVIGIALDPVLDYAYTYEPTDRSFRARLSVEELEPFKKESDFWEKYERSEITGEVLPCEDKKENIWLGESAGIWNYDYNR